MGLVSFIFGELMKDADVRKAMDDATAFGIRQGTDFLTRGHWYRGPARVLLKRLADRGAKAPIQAELRDKALTVAVETAEKFATVCGLGWGRFGFLLPADLVYFALSRKLLRDKMELALFQQAIPDPNERRICLVSLAHAETNRLLNSKIDHAQNIGSDQVAILRGSMTAREPQAFGNIVRYFLCARAPGAIDFGSAATALEARIRETSGDEAINAGKIWEEMISSAGKKDVTALCPSVAGANKGVISADFSV